MKIINASTGKQLKLNKKEWQKIGRIAGWFKKIAFTIDYTIKDLEFEDQKGEIRAFDVDINFEAVNVPAKITNYPETSSPPEQNTTWNILEIREIDTHGESHDVTDTIDRDTKDRLEEKVNNWVNSAGFEIYKDRIQEIRVKPQWHFDWNQKTDIASL
ncbi:MAG TPA: hypothetical protein VMW36_04690 [Patescibacteria group bacterium]|nr:hypothetical protein [Patescibacteria group bacterium]